MGTDSRATMGNFISNKNAQKLYKIDTYAGMTIAGLVGDAQTLVRYMRAEMELYRVQRKINMPIEAAATLLSNMLNQSKYYPYMVQLLVGGYDKKTCYNTLNIKNKFIKLILIFSFWTVCRPLKDS